MSIFRCPSCQTPHTDAERLLGKCAGCGTPFPLEGNASAAAPAPAVTNDFQPVNWNVWFGGALNITIVVLLIILVFRQPTPVVVERDEVIAQEVEKFGNKLQRLENLVNANRTAKNAEIGAFQSRLDTLDTKFAELNAAVVRPGTEAKSKAQAEQISRIEAKLEALAERAFAPPAPPGPLEIKVINHKDWNDAVPENVQAVCVSAAKEIWQHFPNRRLEPITIANSPSGPMVRFGRGPDGERRVLIQIKGRFWAQCAYQFSHEFCHILCNYREGKNPNHWFEEALCETASLFTLRRMAKTWTTNPPYSNWKSYSVSLSDFADETMREVPSLNGMTLAAWFAKNEATLRTNNTDRPRNRVVALALLKILEQEPHHWQAVGYLNQWEPKDGEQSFAAYLADWHRRVPVVHQPFVKDVGKLFDIQVK